MASRNTDVVPEELHGHSLSGRVSTRLRWNQSTSRGRNFHHLGRDSQPFLEQGHP